ncbi:pyridoxamine 5'-phosphate oxidase family protein [Nocardia aurantiaca]|uniref:pyridoxamine 5'-phosphate oxidase family protein n=1 Tax=Nocardia aurantiaca TaxID=2675850 RepID=UPI002E240C88
MTLEQNWDRIRDTVSRAGHCAIASVDRDGSPHVTPIGTFFLRDDATGFYFDQYTEALARNLETEPRIRKATSRDSCSCYGCERQRQGSLGPEDPRGRGR